MLLSQIQMEKLFIYAHSMGGAIVASFFINNPTVKVSGVILSAPALGMNKDLDPLKKGFALYVAKEMREMCFSTGIDIGAISRKAKVIRYFLQCPWTVPLLGGN